MSKMPSNIKFILISVNLFTTKLVVISLLSNFVESDFCTKFKENNRRIDYGYRRMTNKDLYMSYLSIDNTFWRIRFEDQTDETDAKRLLLSANEINFSFNARYQMAFTIYVENSCITGLFNKNNESIDWVKFNESDDEKENPIYINSTKIVFKDFDPTIVFVPNWGQREFQFVYFLEQKFDIKSRKYKRKSRYYNFEHNLEGVDETDVVVNSDSPLKQSAIEAINSSFNIMAIFGQFSDYDQTLTGDGYGSIVLIQMKEQISYCFTHSFQISQKCEYYLPVLIDCDLVAKPIATTEMDSTSIRGQDANSEQKQKTYFLVIVFVVVLILIILSIVIGIFFYFKFKKNKMTSSQPLNKNSEEDEEKSDSIVKTIFRRKDSKETYY